MNPETAIIEIKNLFNQGRHSEAVKKAVQICQNFPSSIEIRKLLGNIHFLLRNFEESIQLFDQVISLNPNDAEAIFNLGILHLQTNQLKISEEYLKHYLSINPNDYVGWITFSEIHFKLKEYKKSIFDCDTAIKINSNFPESWLHKGNAYTGLKQYKEAVYCYDHAINLNPMFFDAFNNKGFALGELNQFTDAITAIDKAIAIKSDSFQAWFNKGNIFLKLNQHTEALNCYNKSIALNPYFDKAVINKSNVLKNLKQYEEALDTCDIFIKLRPNIPEGWSNKASILSILNRFDDAMSCYEQAIALQPDFVAAWSNKGNTLHELKQYDNAISCYDKALSFNPNFSEAWANKANTLNKLGQYILALESCETALKIDENFPEAWAIKADALNGIGKFNEALICYQKAISLDPNSAQAWSNMGNTLNKLKLSAEALRCFEKSIELNPNLAEAWSNKGNALSKIKNFEDSLNCFKKAYQLNPQIDFLLGDIINAKLRVCNWHSLHKNISECISAIENGKLTIDPFTAFGFIDNPELLKRCSQIYARKKFGNKSSNSLQTVKKVKNTKIKLGYFSADFHDHATSYLIAELFELHNREEFEIYGFSFGPISNSQIRNRLEKSFNKFYVVNDLTDSDVSELSRSIDIDIAIDLKGFTLDARTNIFSNRCAPIQVSYLGFPGTMGTHFMDYIIADNVICPEDYEKYYTEKIIYLPDSYQVNDSKRIISDHPFTKAELGLPDNSFVYCCFNNNYKILPEIFDVWMDILKNTTETVIWLFEDNPSATTNLKLEAIKRGVSDQRLIFAKSMPLDKHLSRHKFADLFLDTRPYNAHTTASDALWAGLPILTYPGNSFPSRVASSLLKSVGLDELIVCSLDEYRDKAIQFANNPSQLNIIKEKLANNKSSFPLFDTKRFTANLEKAYKSIYNDYLQGLAPNNVRVK